MGGKGCGMRNINHVVHYCPFCGAMDARYQHVYALDDGPEKQTVHVQCHRCKAQGPKKHSREAALAAWNHRAVELSKEGAS